MTRPESLTEQTQLKYFIDKCRACVDDMETRGFVSSTGETVKCLHFIYTWITTRVWIPYEFIRYTWTVWLSTASHGSESSEYYECLGVIRHLTKRIARHSVSEATLLASVADSRDVLQQWITNLEHSNTCSTCETSVMVEWCRYVCGIVKPEPNRQSDIVRQKLTSQSQCAAWIWIMNTAVKRFLHVVRFHDLPKQHPIVQTVVDTLTLFEASDTNAVITLIGEMREAAAVECWDKIDGASAADSSREARSSSVMISSSTTTTTTETNDENKYANASSASSVPDIIQTDHRAGFVNPQRESFENPQRGSFESLRDFENLQSNDGISQNLQSKSNRNPGGIFVKPDSCTVPDGIWSVYWKTQFQQHPDSNNGLTLDQLNVWMLVQWSARHVLSVKSKVASVFSDSKHAMDHRRHVQSCVDVLECVLRATKDMTSSDVIQSWLFASMLAADDNGNPGFHRCLTTWQRWIDAKKQSSPIIDYDVVLDRFPINLYLDAWVNEVGRAASPSCNAMLSAILECTHVMSDTWDDMFTLWTVLFRTSYQVVIRWMCTEYERRERSSSDPDWDSHWIHTTVDELLLRCNYFGTSTIGPTDASTGLESKETDAETVTERDVIEMWSTMVSPVWTEWRRQWNIELYHLPDAKLLYEPKWKCERAKISSDRPLHTVARLDEELLCTGCVSVSHDIPNVQLVSASDSRLTPAYQPIPQVVTITLRDWLKQCEREVTLLDHLVWWQQCSQKAGYATDQYLVQEYTSYRFPRGPPQVDDQWFMQLPPTMNNRDVVSHKRKQESIERVRMY